ncbi:GTP-binding protein Rhes [Aplochiton taeniatus]
MGIIKTVKARWRQHDKNIAVRSSSTGCRHPSTDRFHKSDETLAALDLNVQTQEAEMHLVNQRNCRRVVVLGAPKVGKTNILRRFLNDDFEEHYEPTAEDFHRKLYHIRGKAYQMDILEAAGERDFPAKRRLSILTGDIFLLVFSVDDRESFKEVCALRNEIIAAKTKLMKLKDTARVPILICGNKVDLDAKRDISRSEMGDFLSDDSKLFEISAKDCTGLEEMFGALARLGGLPTEICPALHRTISIDNLQSLRNSQQVKSWSRALGLQAPCGAVQPTARRPSFTSDLQHVLGARATKRKSIEKCQIQ